MTQWRSRLHVRVAVLVLGLELLLLAAVGTTVYLLCRRDFEGAFDATLAADARAFTAERDVNETPGAGKDPATPPTSFATPGEAGPEVPRVFGEADLGKRTEFAAWDASGALVARSKGFEGLPDWALGDGSRPLFGSVPLRAHERPYRGVYLEIGPEPEDVLRGAGRTVRVLYARSTREVEESLAALRETLGLAILVILLLSGPLAGLLAWRALAPMRRLEHEAGAIGSESRGGRLDLAGVPGDLASLAGAVNSMLDRLEEGFERERRLAQDAAHELRTPVASLKAAVQAALLAPREAAEDGRALGDLLQDVLRLEGLCEALLLTAGPAEGGAPPRSPAEALGSRVAVAAEPFRARAKEGGGSLAVEVADPPPGSPPVATEEVAVRRIITNLVDNSLRHGGPGVSVAVRLGWDAAGAIVAVEDDGAGIPPGQEGRLFERFFRADAARTRKTGGAGLGLALCRSVAEAAGGMMAFERREGRGSRFLWRIPFAAR